MTTPEIGKLEPVGLRSIWPDEARDFTPWLAQNLDLLGAELGMELELDRQEVTLPGGAGRVDILAKQVGSGATVVIENQLEVSDDGHCLRLLGYAASIGADILVWVARGFTEYHRSIVKWINNTDSINIYAVTVESWRIGESRAARFHLVESPQSESGTRRSSSDSPNRNQRYANFYRQVAEKLRRSELPPVGRGGWRGKWRSFQTGHPPHFYSLGLEDVGEARAYFEARGEDAQVVYDALRERRAEIDSELSGATIEWQDGHRWIALKTKASLDDPEEKHEETREWMASNLLKLRNVIQPRLDQIMAELQPPATGDDVDSPTTNDEQETTQ
ncbi:MAG: DUF4268 domain-containing protein [Chloroflexota bacterium]|nr:DUF4268 domain-containing protein [Chloroflexota bacterium]MDE2684379.1 DUF4268 domain-containing protein [Chloroflexota bacterium]